MALRYGIIGCGRISPNHIIAAKKNNLNIVALCDLKIENVDDKILKFDLSKEVKKYINYVEMLENEKLDLIAICTESGSHASIALKCMDYNVHLIIEKPIALSIEDADNIIYKSKEKGLIVSPCHQNRFNKAIIKIKEAVNKKRFGKLFYGTAHIRWNRNYEYYARAPWRGTWENDGGALMNQCIHNIDLLNWIMDSDIDEVFAYTDRLNHSYIEAEDFGVALIKYKNETYGLIEGTTIIYPQNLEETLSIFGEKGTVKVGGQSVNIIEEWRFSDALDEPNEVKKNFSEEPKNVYGFGHTPLYYDIIQAISNKTEPSITTEDGKKAIELILAIYLSSKEGKPVKLPLTKVATIDFKGRFK